MKKSLIALAVSTAVALPGFAAAEVTVAGDARVRMNQKTTEVAAGDKIDASTNSRVRLKVSAKTDGVIMKSRISTSDGTWDGGANNDIKADYAYIEVPVGPVSIVGGRIPDNWGLRLLVWDEDFDTVGVNFKAGGADIALWRITDAEGGAYEDGGVPDEDADTISMGGSVVAKIAMGEVGARTESTTAKDGIGGSESGSTSGLYFKGGLPGGVKLGFEYASKKAATATAETQTGLMLMASKKFGKVNGTFGYFSTTEGFEADDHFAPFAIVGKSQDTAVIKRFGDDMGTGAGPFDTAFMALFGSMSVAAGTTVKVGFAQGTVESSTGSAVDADISITDLQIVHKVNKKTKLVAAYGSIGGDMDAKTQGIRMETKF